MTGAAREVPPDCVSELAACADRESLRACLVRRPDFILAATVQQLAEAVRQRLRVDLAEGLRLADAALEIAEMLGDHASLGRGNRAKANALWYGGDLHASIKLFHTAVAHFEQAGQPEEVGRTLSSSIQPLVLLGDYDSALAAAARARTIFRQTGDPLRMARLEINVANILHRQDRFAEALASYRRAYQELLPYKDAEASAVALHNMAVCLIILNDFDQALETYRDARRLCDKNEMPLLAAQADYNIAYLYFLRGDYDTAIAQLGATKELCLKNGDVYHSALCDLDESEILLELNLPGDAARLAGSAEVEFEKLGMGFERGKALANLAIALHQQGESGRAPALFATAAALFKAEKNEAWQALVGLYRSLVLSEAHEYEPAAQACARALEFFEASGMTRRAVLCSLQLARIAGATSRPEEAFRHCEAALRGLAAIEAPQLSFQAHAIAGDLRQAAGDRSGSYRSYVRARRELESLRSSVQGEEIKIAFLKNKLHVYERLAGFCLEKKRMRTRRQAFAYIEQAKSRSLVEQVFGRLHRVAWSGAGSGVQEKILTLRRELNWYYHRIEIEQTGPDPISPHRIDELRRLAREREDELLRLFRGLAHKGRGETLVEAHTIALSEIQAALGPRASLLEYFQAGDRMIAAVVTQNDIQIERLGPVSEIASSLRMLEFQISKMRLQEFSREELQAPLIAAARNRLGRLFDDLLAPLLGHVAGEHLVIVPHGALHYVPFHALWDGERHVIDRFSVSYSPSAGIYAFCHRKRATANGPSLIMGVHDKRAPRIRAEIRSVASVLPDAVVRVGPQATLDTLKSVGPGCRFIHIATHGVFRRDNPAFSSVQLADGHLSMYDLYELQLPAELFTLSGCGTGLSGIAAGDETLGLMRGLLSAGAQSLLLTMWEVDDRATADFMSVFYRALGDGKDKGAALRRAILEIREWRPHPYFWAPFVLVGKALENDA